MLNTYAIQRRCEHDWRLVTVTQAKTSKQAESKFAYLGERVRAVTLPALAKYDFHDSIKANQLAKEKGFIQ